MTSEFIAGVIASMHGSFTADERMAVAKQFACALADADPNVSESQFIIACFPERPKQQVTISLATGYPFAGFDVLNASPPGSDCRSIGIDRTLGLRIQSAVGGLGSNCPASFKEVLGLIEEAWKPC
jgi:hypothetical protein